LKLVPYSTSVAVAVEGKVKRHGGLEINVPGPNGVTYVASVQPMGLCKLDRSNKKPLGDALVASYWLVRCVQDKNMATMRKATIMCSMTIVAGDQSASHRVTLPILQNIKALKEGDELVLFVEPLVPSSIMPVQKLEQVSKKRPAAATGRMQQTAKKTKKR
jgi:hypothetical protein